MTHLATPPASHSAPHLASCPATQVATHPATRPGRVRLLLAAVTALAVSACTSSGGSVTFHRQVGPVPSGATTSPATPRGTPATPTVDRVAFTDCTSIIAPQLAGQPGAERALRFGCGRLRVPLDYTESGGQEIRLFLVRVHYADQRSRIGSLVVNPGGPGGSGLDAAVGLGLSLPLEVLRRFDVVGFDPRGVGLSEPVECISDALKDRASALDPDARSSAQYAAQVAVTREIATSCAEKYGPALQHYNTEETARDLDLVRQAVGDRQLTYLGYSYGTRLGSVYAQLFPRRVRALVLDGAVDPVAGDVAAAQTQAQGFENAYNQFAASCRQRGSACRIGPDARGYLAGLLDRARRSPIPSSRSGERRRATAGLVLLAAVSALYEQNKWDELESALFQARSGDARGVLTLADEYSQRDSDGHYTNLLDANVVINCSDSPARVPDATVRAKLTEWRRAYPLFGSSLALGLLGCQQWRAPRHPLPAVRAAGAPPILVIGTTHDPATPYASARVLARTLASGVLLSWDGEGHTAYPKTRCISAAVDAYLISLRVPRTGTTCPRS